jgi:hypothetical protein
MTNWNYGDVWETVADVQPDAIAVTQGDRHVTWREFDRGADGSPSSCSTWAWSSRTRWPSTSTTAPSTCRACFAAVKVGLVPVNTNYRYGDDELSYLWENADAVAVVFHGAFAERIEGILGPGARRQGVALGRRRLGPCPDWATPYDEAAKSATGRTAPRGAAAATTSSCSTPAAPPACPRASCGARTTSSPGSSPAACATTRSTAGSRGARRARAANPGQRHPHAGLPAHARHRRVHRQHHAWPRAGGSACSRAASTTRSSCSTRSSARRSTHSSSWATPSPAPCWPRSTPARATGT